MRRGGGRSGRSVGCVCQRSASIEEDEVASAG